MSGAGSAWTSAADAELDAVLTPSMIAAAAGDTDALVLCWALLGPRVDAWATRVWYQGTWRSLELDDVRAEAMLAVLDVCREFGAHHDQARPPEGGGLRYALATLRHRIRRRAFLADGRELPLLAEHVAATDAGAAAAYDPLALCPGDVLALVADMPEPARTIVVGHAAGIPIKRLAAELGMGFEATRKQYQRGLARLRVQLGV